MENPHRHRLYLLALPLFALFVTFSLHKLQSKPRDPYPKPHLGAATLTTSPDATANSTLGFGAILAVSRPDSPRRKGLLWAANLTGLDVVVPEQPQWTDEEVLSFRSREGSRASNGSIKAWMGHLHALRWFLSTRLPSALVLEDDVDWDILLRRQLPLFSTALSVLSSNTTSSPSSLYPHPHPPPSGWDMLWLGHCGDALLPSHLTTHAHLTYADSSVPPRSSLSPSTASLLHDMGVPESSRLVHRSHWPLCTFAYAVTRASAQRILADYASEGEGGCQAYDVRLLEACRDHGWLCYTVAPELFHHVGGASEIEAVDGRDGAKGVGRGSRSGEVGMRASVNIGCGARHGDLWVGEGDEEVRGWVTNRVRRGECLVDWVGEDMRKLD